MEAEEPEDALEDEPADEDEDELDDEVVDELDPELSEPFDPVDASVLVSLAFESPADFFSRESVR